MNWLAQYRGTEVETMITTPHSQRKTMMAAARAESTEINRAIQTEFLLNEDWEKDPFVYNHCKTEIDAIEV